jgi:hypothetical protein
MLHVAHKYFDFTNKANNRMHEALEHFEKKVIEAFEYTQVCWPGGRRKRAAHDELEEELTSAAEANNTELFTLVSSYRP